MNDEYPKNVSTNKDSKSKFWYVSFIAQGGLQKRRSTKVPVEGGFFKGEQLTAYKAKNRALLEGHKIAEEECNKRNEQNNISLRAFLDEYLERRKPYVSQATNVNQRSAFNKFCDFMKRRSNEPISLIARLDVKRFVEERRKDVRQKSVRKDTSLLCSAFNDALDSDIIGKNPFTRIQIAPDQAYEKLTHEAFTLDEIKLMVEKFPPEWSSAIRCCFDTFGQRLGDILSLRWEQFDFEQKVVKITTGKTGKVLVQPMRDDFYEWASKKKGKAKDLLHPRLYMIGTGRSSIEFGQLLRSYGIGVESRKLEGKRRVVNSKTFHCIRATCATLIQSSGISEGMAMKLVGHDSDAIHRGYVRPDVEQLREAANKLPGI